ncbi:hypothetical protein FA95DRAFT_1480565 [Auriscalpium vulgare]|uniref:Uncharacterized protein n=1 Tax=Auriscalpium vulgare TaxID=40419 RepID=A0ACB8SDV2_9AGAM|nr:hypothetical protein FA95DRAFT_1480565 [Auriscalpium vulgare]
MPAWPAFEHDIASPTSPASSASDDDDDVNYRLTPNWDRYRGLLERCGFHLDTVNDVKRFYEHRMEDSPRPFGYYHERLFRDGTALCKDPGLPDNLFRGCRLRDGLHIVVKAVHIRSREYDITRFLSSSQLRSNSMNHCIPVLDFIEVPGDAIVFIVMEEWSSELFPETPCCMKAFLSAIRSCIEHVVFMHHHDIAHLDISLRNLVTDYKGNYACIDYEISRRVHNRSRPLLRGIRGTELPPEVEQGQYTDPFKVDIWALGILILRACHLSGKLTQELLFVTRPMLSSSHDHRPSAVQVLKTFDATVSSHDNVLHTCFQDASL